MKFLLIFSIFLMNLCNLIALDFKKDIEGTNCSVTEPIRNFTFDFNELSSEFGYYINGHDDNMGQYSFNLCKPLSRKCNNQTAAACLKPHRSSKEIIIGNSSKLYWNDGQIRFSYVGEKCNDKEDYRLNVLLHCDYKETKNDFLGVFHIDNQCEINIIMKTPKACLPVPDNIKSAKLFVKTAANETLNFSPLKSSNHFANKPNGGSFVIGFPILYGSDIMCEAGSSVCYIDDKETDIKKKFRNMGTMTSDIKFENDAPVLVMTSNAVCNDKKKFSSKILFRCDKLIAEGSPKFIKERDCVNYFEWETKYACIDEKFCQISGPNGEFYDLSSLVGIQYKIQQTNNDVTDDIHFSICAPAKECGEENWGSCIVRTNKDGSRQTTSTGLFNSNLKLAEKTPYLLLQDGSKCNANGTKFSTRIEFIVADNPEDEEVVLIEDMCGIVVHVKTLLVNQNVKNCMVKNRSDVEFDLRKLINYNGNYEAIKADNESSNVHYFLNVCRPLNSKYSLNCHGNTAACRTILKDDKHEEELSLGHFEYVMSTEAGKNGSTNVIMKYFGGSKCPEDEDENISTSVKFYCDELAGLGNPIFKSLELCEYHFDFPTNILCNDRILRIKTDDSCELINDKTSKSINLKIYGVFESDNAKIDICDKSTKFYTIDYKNSMVVIESAQNEKDVQVQLKCSLSNSTKMNVHDDRILIMNESPMICPILNIVPRTMEFVTTIKASSDKIDNETKPSNDEQKKSDNTSSGGFSIGYLFLIAVLVMAFGVLYLVLRNPERREIILSIAKFRSRSNVRYARVHVNEESALLTDNNELIASDSDDENILL